MWPLIRGDLAASLRRNDDLMFALQHSVGLALVLMCFVGIMSLLCGLILDMMEIMQYLLFAEIGVGGWMCMVYAHVSRWRRLWAEAHADVGFIEEPKSVGVSIRQLAIWRRKDKVPAASAPGGAVIMAAA